MPPAPPGILELAFYLRKLRMEHWPGEKVTQAQLAAAFSEHEKVGATAVASWENGKKPNLPPTARLMDYAQFFATRRSLAGEKRALIPVDTFTEEEQAEYERLRSELLSLHATAAGTKPTLEAAPAPRSWLFPGVAPVTLVCSELPPEERPAISNPGNPNFTQLLSFGDLDALVELYGHVRAENPMSQVAYKSAPHVVPKDLSSHLVLIGGIGWNPVTERILSLARLPVEQRDDPSYKAGDPFTIKDAKGERSPRPEWSETDPPELLEDIGLLARMPNPMNTSRTLTVCNGVHSRGVLGAVRSLTDPVLREKNERYIAENLPGDNFGIVMRVPIITGDAITPDLSNPVNILYQWSAEA